MATITINGNSLDPVSQAAGFQSFGLESVDTSASDYILLQTKGPLTKEQKKEIASKGVKILEYVPDNAYIAYYPPTDLTPVKQLPYVTWAGPYPKQVKVQPSLRPQAGGGNSARVMNALAIPQVANPLEHRPRTIEIALHHNVQPEAARASIAQAAGLDPSAIKMDGRKVRLTVSETRLDKIAQLDIVRHIEEFSGQKLYNNVALQLLSAAPVHSGIPAFEGAGEIVAVCDTGLDTGDPTAIHSAFAGRVLKLYPIGRASASDPNGHGTHVAGSVLGDGVLPDGTPIRGTAPKASLVLQSVLNGNGGLSLPSDLGDLFAPPYTDDGARVHSNSWGDRVGDGRYSQQSREVDAFVWTHRDCVICFAAGNDAADQGAIGKIAPGSVGAPGTAKNCITVGASESLRPDNPRTYSSLSHSKFPVNPIASDRIADNAQGVAAFSGRGPTRDHRIKPDVVSPGCTILSAKSSLIDPNSFWGDSPEPDLYMFDAGTSMATPLVAGCAAVIRESFRVRRNHNPSAALVKAMLVNGSVFLRGQYSPPELAPIPNEAEGFGLVSLAQSLAPVIGDPSATFWDEDQELDVGDERTEVFTVPPGAKSLKVTLVWTDPPGEAIQNDLDLIVEAVRDSGTTVRHGNMPPDLADFDRTNNVEQVIWDGITPGDVRITVRAFRVTVDPQSYALVVRVA